MTHFFEEYETWIVHDRLAIGVQRLMLAQMAVYRRCLG